MSFNWLNQRFIDRPDSGAAGLDPARALDRWRAVRLAETIGWAAEHSAYYRQHLDRQSVGELLDFLQTGPSAGEAGRALAALPFTRSEDLADNSLDFLAVAQDEVEGIVSVPTSGTSGPAKRIFSTAADLEETATFFEYGMRFLVSPGRDRVALAMSQARPGNVGDLLGRALARWDIPFLAHGFVPEDSALENQWLQELAAWSPTCLVGVPAQMLALSRHRQAGRLKTLKSMLLSGDVAEDWLVRELERNFPGCLVFRHYGLTEGGLGGAVECRQRQWPHLRDDLWVEIVDAEGRPLPAGERGEIVITPLTRRALPLLRYRTGDEGCLFSEPCPCGAWSPRLRAYGRLADRIPLPGRGSLRVSDFETPLFSFDFIRDFDVAWKGGSDLTIIIRLGGNRPADAAELIGSRLKESLGPSAGGLGLSFEFQEHAEGLKRASGGKRRLIRR